MATATATKTFTIIKTRNGVETPVMGTLAELVNYYRYTREYVVPAQPSDIAVLLSELNKNFANDKGWGYNTNRYALGE